LEILYDFIEDIYKDILLRPKLFTYLYTMSVKKFSWTDIISKLGEKATNTHFVNAIDYYCNFYSGDIQPERKRFTEKEVAEIIAEITDDAEHKMRLEQQEERARQLRIDWPNVDEYIQNICNRGPFPGSKN